MKIQQRAEVRAEVWLPERRKHVPFEIAVHDGEEDLEEQVDGIYQHGEEVQPRFARHRDRRLSADRGDERICFYGSMTESRR